MIEGNSNYRPIHEDLCGLSLCSRSLLSSFFCDNFDRLNDAMVRLIQEQARHAEEKEDLLRLHREKEETQAGALQAEKQRYSLTTAKYIHAAGLTHYLLFHVYNVPYSI